MEKPWKSCTHSVPVVFDNIIVSTFREEEEKDTAASQPLPQPSNTPVLAAAHSGRKRIVIDLGHGVRIKGICDPGAIKNGVMEAEVVEKIGERLQLELENRGYEAILTRGINYNTQNRTHQLLSRAKAANDLNADLFISLHADSFSDPSVKGVRVYHSHEDKKESKLLANVLADKSFGISKRARFLVLDEDTHGSRPAVLLETGFLTNEEDRKLLNSPQGQKLMALTVADGIDQYFYPKAPAIVLADAANEITSAPTLPFVKKQGITR